MEELNPQETLLARVGAGPRLAAAVLDYALSTFAVMVAAWNGTGMGTVGEGMYYVPADVYMYRLAYRWGVDGNQGIEPQFETGTVTVIR
ncbi:MAG: hypothetical protein ACPG66_02910 [Flavobacteriales bacterium]